MTTALITHPACLLHELPQGHPERPARLKYVLNALAGEPFDVLLRKEAPKADEDALARVHSRDFIRDILDSIPESGFAQLDSDTIASPGTGEAILRAAGALILGVDMVMGGEAKNVFCAVRPPGHHAEPTKAMGFCLFNNIAIGALHARQHHRLGIVLDLRNAAETGREDLKQRGQHHGQDGEGDKHLDQGEPDRGAAPVRASSRRARRHR